MEHSQLSQMVSWLDQAHQRDRLELDQLRQQVEQLSGERDDTARRMARLESDLAALRGGAERLSWPAAPAERFEEQGGAALERGEAQRQQAPRQGDQPPCAPLRRQATTEDRGLPLRQAETANVIRSVGDFRQDMDRFRRYDEELASRRLDIQRLAADIARLQQAVTDAARQRDEWAHSAGFVEEQRRQDARRITDIQSQIAEEIKRVDGIVPRMQYLEQMSSRVMEIKNTIEELRLGQSKGHEKRQFLEAQIERQIKLWGEEIEGYRLRVDGHERRMEQYTEYHQVVKKATEGLQSFQEQITRLQHETGELQRLSQNRQKTQMEEWQTQQEQRWQQHGADWDRQWTDYERTVARLGDRTGAIELRVSTFEKRLHLLIQIAEEDAQLRAMSARDWQARFEQVMENEA